MKIKKFSTSFLTNFFCILIVLLLTACGRGDEGQIRIDQISITASNSSPVIGEELQLSASVVYSDTRTENIDGATNWSSSDTTIATISENGEVDSLLAGDVTFTATYNGFSQGINITIRPLPVVTSIHVFEITNKVIQDDLVKLRLEAKLSNGEIITDNSLFEWTSSDNEIATVDAGEVTTLNYGEVEISASKDGVSSLKEIDISPKIVEVRFPPDTIYLTVNDKNAKAITKAKFSDDPADAEPQDDVSNDVVWFYENEENIVLVDRNGNIHSNKAGIVNVTAKIKDFDKNIQFVVEDPIELFVVNDTKTKIELNWKERQDVSKYHIYVNSTGDVTKDLEPIPIIDSNSYTHTIENNALPYYFRITFFRNDIESGEGKESDISPEIKVWPHENRWQHRESPKSPFRNAASTLINNQYFVFGGEVLITTDEETGNKEWKQSNSILEYNFNLSPINDEKEWTDRNSLPHNIINASACSAANKSIFLFGGNKDGETIDTVYEYYPSQAVFSERPIEPIPTPLQNSSCVGIGNTIYLIGGLRADGTVSDSVYVFDAESAIWNTDDTSSLITARSNHSSVVLNDSIFTSGGVTANGEITGTVEKLHLVDGIPNTNSWESTSALRLPRKDFQLTHWNSRLYALGGIDGDNNILSNVESFDPSTTELWSSEKHELPLKNANFNLAKLENNIYIFGGAASEILDITEQPNYMQLDTITETWLPRPTPSIERTNFSSTLLNNYLILAGGLNESSAISDAELYNIETNTWEVIDSLKTPRSNSAIATWKNTAFIIGGNSGDQPLHSTESFTPSESTWQLKAEMNVARELATAATFQDLIYVFGGLSAEASSTFEYYDIANDTWRIGGNLPTPRSNATSIVLNDKIYLIGGKIDGKPSNSVEIYNPRNQRWQANIPTLNTPVIDAGSATLNGKIYVFSGITDTSENSIESDSIFHSLTQIYTPSFKSENESILATGWNKKDSRQELPLILNNASAGIYQNKIFVISEIIKTAKDENNKDIPIVNNPIFVYE